MAGVDQLAVHLFANDHADWVQEFERAWPIREIEFARLSSIGILAVVYFHKFSPRAVPHRPQSRIFAILDASPRGGVVPVTPRIPSPAGTYAYQPRMVEVD